MTQIVRTTPVEVSESEHAPPFAAMNALRNTRTALDETITALIGRLQPYVEDTKPRAEVRDVSKDSMPGDSALERVIGSETLFIGELNDRLIELVRDLRL